MVQRTQVVLVDDVDGGEASETVVFGLDGASYEIDLSADNAAQLRESVARWVGAGRKIGRSSSTGRVSRGGSGRSSASSSNANEIREWARANGHQVSDRGRISAEVMAAYAAR